MLRATATDADLCQLEHTGFGVSHDALGAALCESWGLGAGAVASVRHHVTAQGLLELSGAPARRTVLALSVIAAAISDVPTTIDEVVPQIAPQAGLDTTLVLRAARKLADDLQAAHAHGR